MEESLQLELIDMQCDDSFILLILIKDKLILILKNQYKLLSLPDIYHNLKKEKFTLLSCQKRMKSLLWPTYICDAKENGIHRSRPLSSTAQWFNSDAHMPIVVAFGIGQGSAWAS